MRLKFTLDKKYIQYIFLILSCILIGLFYLRITPVRATFVPIVVDLFVNNSAYVFTNQYSTASPFTPTAGAVKMIYVNGRVMDEDGVGGAYEEGDINTIELQLYRSAIGANCDTDPNTCYRTYCNVRANSPNVLDYSCGVELSYLIDATTAGSTYASQDWTVEIIAIDDIGGLDNLVYSIEVDSILSVSIPSSLAFGQLVPGTQTTAGTNTSLTFTQEGNTPATLEISGEALTCNGIGSIPRNHIEWSLQDVEYEDTNSHKITSSPVSTEINIGTDDDGTLLKDLYFNIRIPLGVSGSCTGQTQISVMAQ